MSEPESLRFFDWFTYDYEPEERPRLIELYQQEKEEMMDDHEGVLLKGWLAAEPSCAHELVDALGEGKRILHLRNVLDDKVKTVTHSGGPGRAEIGDVLVVRLLPFRDELRMSGATGYLPAAEAVDLKSFIMDGWRDYQETNPELKWDLFLRQRSYLFAHFELEAAKKAGRPPVARLDPNQPKSKVGQVMRRVRRRR